MMHFCMNCMMTNSKSLMERAGRDGALVWNIGGALLKDTLQRPVQQLSARQFLKLAKVLVQHWRDGICIDANIGDDAEVLIHFCARCLPQCLWDGRMMRLRLLTIYDSRPHCLVLAENVMLVSELN